MNLINLDELNRLVEICKILSTAPFYQKLGPGGVLAIYLTAIEMKLPPMFCLNGGLHNIEGKVVLSGQLINMMLVNAGFGIEFVEMTDEVCNINFHYPRSKRVENFKYTVEDAKKAGYFGIQGPNGTLLKKPKDNWIYHTKDMLFARCITSGGRKYAPTVLGNCYAIGELDNDDHIIPISPDLPTISVPKETTQISPSENLQIELDKIQATELEKFRADFKIKEGEPIYDYIVKIAKQKEISNELGIELAFKNRDKFLKAFDDMQAKKKV